MPINITEANFSKDELLAVRRIVSEFEIFFAKGACNAEISILNFQLPAGYVDRDIDILILMKIADGEVVRFNSGGTVVEMEGGFIFNIEVKSHSHFALNGSELEVSYHDGTKKNASRQAWNVRNNLLNFLKKNLSGDIPLISEIVFLPSCARETTLALFGSEESIPQNFLDNSFTAEDLFNVIVRNGQSFSRYGNRSNAQQVDVIKILLFGSKLLPKHYANKFELLTINSLKSEQAILFENSNDHYVLRGSPGAGKTILMLGKCMDLISHGHNCLYLTYNRQLVLDLQRLQDSIKSIAPTNPLVSLRFETWESFVTRLYGFYNYFRPLGSPPLTIEDKASEILKRYQNTTGKELLVKDEAKNSKNIFKYSAVNYVFVDEAQDLPDTIFNILVALFSSNICLAIGDQQEYASINRKETKNELHLKKIYRQREVPSHIVRSLLEKSKIEHMYQVQQPIPLQLVGGISVVYSGEVNERFYNGIFEYLEKHGMSMIDFLHLHINQGDAAANTLIPHYCGGNVDENVNFKLTKFRYFHYNSCRGLEANIILFEKLDSYYEWCVNMFGEAQAKNRLFVALTRVKDIAIFTFADLNHWLYKDVVANFSRIRSTIDL